VSSEVLTLIVKKLKEENLNVQQAALEALTKLTDHGKFDLSVVIAFKLIPNKMTFGCML
jgi:hypothetical protein